MTKCSCLKLLFCSAIFLILSGIQIHPSWASQGNAQNNNLSDAHDCTITLSPADDEKVYDVTFIGVKLSNNRFADHIELTIGNQPPQTIKVQKGSGKTYYVTWDIAKYDPKGAWGKSPFGPVTLKATVYDLASKALGEVTQTPIVYQHFYESERVLAPCVDVTINPKEGEQVHGVRNIVVNLVDQSGDCAGALTVGVDFPGSYELFPKVTVTKPKMTYTFRWDTRLQPDGPAMVRATTSAFIPIDDGSDGSPPASTEMKSGYAQSNVTIDNTSPVVENSVIRPTKPPTNKDLIYLGQDKSHSIIDTGDFAKADGPAEISVPEFSSVKLNGEDLEDVSRSMSFEDLNGKPAVLSGNLNDNAPVDHLEVSLDGGFSWHNIEGISRWSYSFSPAPNQDYDIKFRAVYKDGKALDIKTANKKFKYKSENLNTTPHTASSARIPEITSTTALSTSQPSGKSIGFVNTTPDASAANQDNRKKTFAVSSAAITEKQ